MPYNQESSNLDVKTQHRETAAEVYQESSGRIVICSLIYTSEKFPASKWALAEI